MVGALEPSRRESVPCYCCGSSGHTPFVTAEDDLTGKPGRFTFVRCNECGLVFQTPRIDVETIKSYYDDEYVAHRKKNDWGILTRFFNATMDRLDTRKLEIARRYVSLDNQTEVLDVGCGAATFLIKVRSLHGSSVTGVDFIDLSQLPGFDQIDFRCGLFYETDLDEERFDLITMWHFLEHDYDPLLSLRRACGVLKPGGVLVVEVPRLDCLTHRLYRERWPGLQAPQHTALYSRDLLHRIVAKAGLEVVDYLPYGAYPAYFYLFAGAAFKLLKGKGLNLSKAIYPYFLGRLLLAPVLLFEKRLNLAMQTIVCRRVP
jgi:SAM-dependent methyltransferase